MNSIQLLKKMAAGERIYGTLITSASPFWISKIKTIGLDFVFIDTEHNPMDRIALSHLCNSYKGAGLATLTRIPSPSPFDASMALDAGSNGILAPYIESPEQVRNLVGAVKYRPLKGKRLEGVLGGSVELTQNELDFFGRYNEGNFLFINIESQYAIDNLDEILAVPGFDGIIIGPHDLSINLGVPEQFSSKVFLDAVSHIIRKTLEHGKMVGNHFSFGIDYELEWARQGMNIILHSIDLTVFANTMREELNIFRKLFGEPIYGADGNIERG